MDGNELRTVACEGSGNGVAHACQIGRPVSLARWQGRFLSLLCATHRIPGTIGFPGDRRMRRCFMKCAGGVLCGRCAAWCAAPCHP